MELLRFRDLERWFGARCVLRAASGAVREGQHIALVGRNGAGKSTLFSMLAGAAEQDGGAVSRARGVAVGWFRQTSSESLDGADQRSGAAGSRTLRTYVAEAFAHMEADERELARLEREMGRVAGDEDELERVMAQYARLRERFERAGGHDYAYCIDAVLRGVGFAQADDERRLETFSGGEKTRAALARVLLDAPDLLLLDEPTNHLDIAGVEWMESFLARYSGGVVVVSHDRWFLDRVVNAVWLLENGQLSAWEGNYSRFVELKAQADEERERRIAAQERGIARERKVIAELATHGSHNYVQLKARARRLQRLERLAPPQRTRTLRVSFRRARPLQDPAVELRGVSKSFGGRRLFAPLTLIARAGECLGIIGANGAGKSTLLRMLTGEVSPDTGEVVWSEGVQRGWYAQETAALDPEASVLEELLRGWLGTPEEARGLLGALLFSGDEQERRVALLSGGERRRLMLAKMVARPANVLLLDEPTNDLDIPSREILEEVLAAFEGTVVLVSHDRFLLERLCDRVVEIAAGEARVFEGGYAELAAARVPAAAQESPRIGKTARERRKAEQRSALAARGETPKRRFQDVERAIEGLEREIAQGEGRLGDSAIYRDGDAVRALQERLSTLREELERLEMRWAELVDLI
ncbi:MAG: ABC-F family ATP-binding cassette domain-containing protein [bacterium]|nr:ABC-F family ATP-binding cassette domain-containing protein [bacterium]